MPEITISEAMRGRLVAFKDVIEAVIEEEVSLDDCAEIVLEQGINSMMADLLEPIDPVILLKSFQQLGSQYPAQVYRYIAETMKEGDITLEQENLKHKLGFRTPTDEYDD